MTRTTPCAGGQCARPPQQDSIRINHGGFHDNQQISRRGFRPGRQSAKVGRGGAATGVGGGDGCPVAVGDARLILPLSGPLPPTKLGVFMPSIAVHCDGALGGRKPKCRSGVLSKQEGGIFARSKRPRRVPSAAAACMQGNKATWTHARRPRHAPV
jgi:hypothetical protein